MNEDVENNNNNNNYNHYWMQAIVKNGWSIDGINVNYLNLQDVLYSLEPKKLYPFNDVIKKSKIRPTTTILGSQVISKNVEKVIGVNNIERGMLDFLYNRINLTSISLDDQEVIKRYCHLQSSRSPLHYESKRSELLALLEKDSEFIRGIKITDELNFKNKSLNVLSGHEGLEYKIQSKVNHIVANSFDKNNFDSLMGDKKIKIINIAKYGSGIVLGDFTCISFSSIIRGREKDKTILESFITEYKISEDITNLYGSYLFPITSSSFIYLYKNEEQLSLLEDIIENFVYFHNQLQFSYSPGVVIPFNFSSNELFHENAFMHYLEKKEIRSYLDTNLGMSLNKKLQGKEVDYYLINYDEVIKDINKLNIFNHSSFDLNNNKLYEIFHSQSQTGIDFDLRSYDELQIMMQDIFLYSLKSKDYLFFFTKDGTVLYSINNSKFKLFCLNYFDFISRFLFEIIMNKIVIPIDFYFKMESLIKKYPLTDYNNIAQFILMKCLRKTVKYDIFSFRIKNYSIFY